MVTFPYTLYLPCFFCGKDEAGGFKRWTGEFISMCRKHRKVADSTCIVQKLIVIKEDESS